MESSPIQCSTCGVEHDVAAMHSVCPICADERQYLPTDGIQAWSRPEDFDGSISVVELEPDLWGIDVEGEVGIGQQAKVVVTEAGCVMVDVPAAITSEAVEAVRSLGSMRAIIPTHPHMFGAQSLWSRALEGAPVWVSRPDLGWLGLQPPELYAWDGVAHPVEGVTAFQPGGHFPGSSVVYWPGRDDAGVMLVGDTIAANPDQRTVTFLRSYPNRIPLSGRIVQRIANDVGRFRFDRLYSNFAGRISSNADEAVTYSAQRYIDWVNGRFDHLTGSGTPTVT